MANLNVVSPGEIASVKVLDVGKVEFLKFFHHFPTAIAACAVNEHGFLEIEVSDFLRKLWVAEGDVLCVREGSAPELSRGANVKDLCVGVCIQPRARFSSGEVGANFSRFRFEEQPVP